MQSFAVWILAAAALPNYKEHKENIVREITANEFTEATKEGFHIVGVYGTHCGPCQVLAKTSNTMDRDYQFISNLKSKYDNNKQSCIKNHIFGVPTLLFMVDREIKQRETGSIPESQIMEITPNSYIYELF